MKSAPSVEERLRNVRNDVSLIIASLTTDVDDLPLDADELSDALHAAALRCRDEIACLQQLPADILNTAAPDDDERDEPEGGGR